MVKVLYSESILYSKNWILEEKARETKSTKETKTI